MTQDSKLAEIEAFGEATGRAWIEGKAAMRDTGRSYVEAFAAEVRSEMTHIREVVNELDRVYEKMARQNRAYVYWLASEPWYRHLRRRWRLRYTSRFL